MLEREVKPPREVTTNRGAGNQPLVETFRLEGAVATTTSLLSVIVRARGIRRTE
jgi:hypothetical protein